MHETRNFVLVILLVAAVVWALSAWIFFDPETARWLAFQRGASLLVITGSGAWLWYALKFEDRLPDHLRNVVGAYYYEADGLSFMPVVRVRDRQAELCIYYQNRYENPVDAIIHFRLRRPADHVIMDEGFEDIHFAFRASGGDFGMIHQAIAVPQRLQGQVVTLLMAAATYYPRSRGACWRRTPGRPCGTVLVDWNASVLKSDVYEGVSEMDLIDPVQIHLPMPLDVSQQLEAQRVVWRQEQLIAGA